MSEKPIRVSSIQRQFWLAQQFSPDSAAYNVCSAFAILGNFDVGRFRSCVLETVREFDTFRSRFEIVDGQLHRFINDEPIFETIEIRIDGTEDEEFLERARIICNEHASMSFDLSAGPLVRLVVTFGNASSVTYIALIIHHIAIDLRSKELLGQRLSDLYNGYPKDKEKSDVQESYESFCKWEELFLLSDRAQNMREFWKVRLQEKTLAIPLIYDFVPPAVATSNGDVHRFILDSAIKSHVEQLRDRTNIDSFVILLAAYFALLQKYSRCNNFVVGVPLSNRRQDSHKDIMGCFVNTLPLTVDIDDNADFISLLHQVRLAMLFGHRNQSISLEQIVEDLGIRKDASRNPVYQVGFTFEHPMMLELKNLKVEPHACFPNGSQLELFLRFYYSGDEIKGQLEYNTSLFSKDSAVRFVVHYYTLLNSLLQNPEHPLRRVNVLSSSDRTALMRFNDTERPYELLSLKESFERQADRTPSNVALSFYNESISYAQLDCLSNRVSHWLLTNGVKQGDRIAVCMNRCVEMFVAIYGIIKTGAAYVPIDPDYPRTRSSQIIEDVLPKFIIASDDTASTLPLEGNNVVEWAKILDESVNFSTDRINTSISLTAPAYIIYTSGTTGRPKGVVNCHEGIANRLCWMQEKFPLTTSDVILFKTPFTFDVSVWEIFWALQVGASIVISPPGSHKDPVALREIMDHYGVTTVHFVPSMLEMFLSQEIPLSKGHIQRVICSGEALSIDLKERFFERYPHVELHNLYGPTEAAVDVTHFQCSKKEKVFVPIGKAISNTHMYIMDKEMRPLPIGIPGEICIGGVQVGKGYWNNDELTQSSFVTAKTPFGNERIYRTGDLGLFLPSGDIRFLGRLDFQVKIRGNRIETGEVECTLRSHVDVRDAVVIAKVVTGTEPSLIAYVACKEQVEAKVLKEHVAQILPSYMVPSFIVLLQQLPLNASGKVDRKALPEVDAFSLLYARNLVGAKSNTEADILTIWKKVLKTDHIGVTDNFIDVGGNSLLLVKVSAELTKRWKEKIDVLTLLRYPTIEKLAQYLKKENTDVGDVEKKQLKDRMSVIQHRQAAFINARQQKKHTKMKE